MAGGRNLIDISLPRSLSLSHFLSLWLTLSLSLSIALSLFLSLPLFLSLYLSPSLPLSLHGGYIKAMNSLLQFSYPIFLSGVLQFVEGTAPWGTGNKGNGFIYILLHIFINVFIHK